MRFQPITGQLLAAASDKVVSIFDVENDRQLQSFQVFLQLLCVVDYINCYLTTIYVSCTFIFSVCSNHDSSLGKIIAFAGTYWSGELPLLGSQW